MKNQYNNIDKLYSIMIIILIMILIKLTKKNKNNENTHFYHLNMICKCDNNHFSNKIKIQ